MNHHFFKYSWNTFVRVPGIRVDTCLWLLKMRCKNVRTSWGDFLYIWMGKFRMWIAKCMMTRICCWGEPTVGCWDGTKQSIGDGYKQWQIYHFCGPKNPRGVTQFLTYFCRTVHDIYLCKFFGAVNSTIWDLCGVVFIIWRRPWVQPPRQVRLVPGQGSTLFPTVVYEVKIHNPE